MISRVIRKTVDLDAFQKVDQLEGPLYQLEESGHTFDITCMSGGTAAAVSGTVSGRFLRADETTVYFTGTLAGNVASITLPQSCYNVNGRFGLVVFISGNDVTSAIYAVAGNVYRSTSDTIIDPTGEIPSLEELMAQIEACEEATASAQQAASFVNSIIAPTYSTGVPYAIGDYCTYEGSMYRATAATSGEFDPSNWEMVLVGGEFSRLNEDVDDLKSAIDDINGLFAYVPGVNLIDPSELVDGYLNADGTIHANGSSQHLVTSGFIDVSDFSSVCFSYTNNNQRARLTVFFITKYNAQKEVLGQENSGYHTYSIPTGVSYIRFSYDAVLYADVMCQSGTEISAEFIPYSPIVTIPDSPYLSSAEMGDALKNGSFLENEAIKSTQTDFITTGYGKNMYTGQNNVDGYLNSNGTIHANSSSTSWYTIDFINVSDWDYVTFSAYVPSSNKRAKVAMYFLITYDAQKNVIGQKSSPYPSTYTVESGVSYIRFCVNGTTNISDLQIENSNEMTGYVPFKQYLVLKNEQTVSWKDKLWCCVGDSLTEVNSRTDKHYYDYIAELTGIRIYNMGVGGTGYIRGQNDSNAFYQRISAVPIDADVITIFGSMNDLGSGADLGNADDTGTTTIAGCINTTLDNLFTAYPLANVGVVTPTPWDGNGYAPIDEPNAASRYCDMIIQICKNRSIPCLDLFHSSLLRPWDSAFKALAYSKDGGSGVHPDETGHKLIAPRFKGFLDSLLL